MKILAKTGIDAVAEREVDDSVGSAEVHGRFGAFLRERIQTFAHATRQQNHEAIVDHRPTTRGRGDNSTRFHDVAGAAGAAKWLSRATVRSPHCDCLTLLENAPIINDPR